MLFRSDKKAQGGREQLSHLRNADGILRDLALFNTGGSFAQEGKKAEARAAYAELIQHLNQKQKLNETESSLLAQTKRNLARLADPSQQPQSDQKQQQEQQKDQQNKKEGSSDHKNPDSQKGEGEKEKNQSSDQKKSPDGDAKGNEQKNAQGGNPKEDNKEEKGANSEKKEPQKENEGDQKEQRKNRQDARAPVRGSQPFKERDDMGEEEAKRILGALREQESDLQKKFLKNKIRGGKVNSHDAAKDW